ncbi:hypothetical protein RvY_16725 [Ramazzottius varieornatus]|uniref:Neurensin-1 n=1 Tax=Ramazzottius varieornatus TaxID=947166 RepID=A0A1D1W3U0_RAMVA|nr:hypothetical protein RvY_16725 [Ramazzottius varieornatus]
MSDTKDDDQQREKVKKRLLCQQGQSSSKLDYKGVKSYLHQFYDFATDSHDKEYHIRTRHVRMYSLCWRTALTIGIIFIVGGLLAALLAYLIPRKRVLVEEEDDIVIMDKDAVWFNRILDYVKLAGLATFCFGGLLASFALFLASCCFRRCNGDAGRYYEDIEPSNVVQKLVTESHENDPGSPMDKKVFGVQPSTSGSEGFSSAVPLITTEESED